MDEVNDVEKRPPGRPSKLTPSVEARILNAVRCGAPRKTACAAAGVSEATLYSWLRLAEKHPKSEYGKFAAKLEQARQEGIIARLAHIQKAAAKDWRASAWLLERDMPEHFSPKARLEHGLAPKVLTLTEALVRLRQDRPSDEPPGEIEETETC